MARRPVVGLIAVAILLGAAMTVEAQITCTQVVSYLFPCLGYVQGIQPLTGSCCNGVRSLNAAAKSREDRQTTCNCLMRTAAGVQGIQPGLISGIPAKCNVAVPYPINPNADCSRIN
ncbi:non-specific lipid-transfer protein 1-like [Zingiber officinale]|uniref:non-specific lipid-transfer protein 1-like n=1 Tax=Zingiber officinale TaxID=94328 RepID=UPI001C4B8C65|nr:non-specific lipid-transfer protein 1-like [Zingiber officinale]